MAVCNICGKEIDNKKPMVLIGYKHFTKPAPPGYEWANSTPAIELWKAFALLSVGVCPKCNKRRKTKLIMLGLALCCLSSFLTWYISSHWETGKILFSIAFGLAGICSLAYAIYYIVTYKKTEGSDEAFLSYLKRSKTISRNDIIALPDETEENEITDINTKEFFTAPDKIEDYGHVGKKRFELQVFAKENLLHIGSPTLGDIGGIRNSWGNTSYHITVIGLDEVLQNAKAMFEKIGEKFEV